MWLLDACALAVGLTAGRVADFRLGRRLTRSWSRFFSSSLAAGSFSSLGVSPSATVALLVAALGLHGYGAA